MIVDGRAIRGEIEAELKMDIEKLTEAGRRPNLTAIMVGEDEGSKIYHNMRMKACTRVGIQTNTVFMDENASMESVVQKVKKLNNDLGVHAVIIQAPLPKHLNFNRIIDHLDPRKDVEGLTPINYGKLIIGDEGLTPCTATGCVEILERAGIEFEGKDVVIVNHSPIVGKPLSLMMLNRNATTHVCHIFTRDMEQHTKKADILVVGVGKPKFITADMVKEGAAVIDVGMNRVDGKVCGDVDFDGVSEKAGLITPTPGGTGPVTVAMLLRNTLKCARNFM
jgi:methylenetetrahydrofolate dehydrogenase (NADP+)/methenyltetrahydrofolate cyclohydrolase